MCEINDISSKEYRQKSIMEKLEYHILKKSIDLSKPVQLCIARTSPGEKPEIIHYGTLNDFVIKTDGTLELWQNNGYEI